MNVKTKNKGCVLILTMLLILSFTQTVFAETVGTTSTTTVKPIVASKPIQTKLDYKAEVLSKTVLYKDTFDDVYKIGYKLTYKNIGKNDWQIDGANQITLEAKNDLDTTFLNSVVKADGTVEFKFIFAVNKLRNNYINYIYLSKDGKEITGSGVNININLNNIKTILPSEKLMDIAPVEQQYTLNCESASLQMGLSYFGINKTQDELLQEVGFSTKLPAKKIGDRIVWGDPDEGFVGDYNGLYSSYCSNQTGDQTIRTLKCATGWGVNNKPIAKTAQKYLKNTYYLNNASIADLKSELADGNPIVFWEVKDNKMPEESINIYTEKTWKKINYIRTHVVLLIGYKNIFNDTVYTFDDPATGERVDLVESDMQRIWDRYNDNIVVLKK